MKINKSFNQWLNRAKDESEALKTPDYLWQNIVRDLEKPRQKKSRWSLIGGYFSFRPKWKFALGGLVLVLATGLMIRTLKTPRLIDENQAEYLASEINEEVYTAQHTYEKAISKLEKRLQRKYEDPDNEWIRLSLERIDMIDELIRECKTSLEDNPYNPVIQRTLFTAYGEKLETIQQLLAID
ncbi:MAG: hypothetical protein GXO90_01370 [FCB group bacterium]|nr:hypothetical protein [FCB group bacterium]